VAHITRFEAPWFLEVNKKEYKWAVRSNAGPHKLSESVPLALLLKHYMKVADTTREAKRLIFDGKVLVDGKIRKDYKYPVGLMDVISIPSADLFFRVVPDNTKYLSLAKITKEDAKYKFVRITNKTTNKHGNLQLNLEDGRNILIPKEKINEMKFPTLSTLKIELPSQNIIASYEIKEGKYAIIVGGRNVGLHGIIKSIQYANYKKAKYSIVTIEQKNGEIVQTNLQNVMVIGDTEPDPNIGVR